MTTSQIVVGTAKATELQEEIQKKLIDSGHATDGDTVMAEFILVMLANQKTPPQITAELTDLIGSEYEASFTDSLFRTVAELYAPAPVQRPQRIETVDDSTDQRFRRSAGRGAGQGMLRSQNRITPYNPMKRGEEREYDMQIAGRAAAMAEQQPPIDAPRGPRRNNVGGGGPPGRTIFDRVDARPGPMYGNGHVQNAMNHGGMGMNGFGGQGVFNPRANAAPFFPTHAPPQFSAPAAPMLPPVPGRPLNEALCKFGVTCKNAWCTDSHPSPVATAASGLVLSTEPCEKQLFCNDPDCPKAHISQQARNPAASMTPPPPKATKPARSFANGMDIDVDPANKKATPCKFGNACTRPGCFFSHPWDQRANAGATVCKFGQGCTRPDCHFKHPEGRAMDKKLSKNKTATFGGNNTVLSSSQSSAGMAAPETSDSQMSERLKRFSQSATGEMETIIPGQAVDATMETSTS